MSIYTYNSAKSLCEVLGITFTPDPAISDQELDKIPEGSALAGTDYVSGMKWITNGSDNSYIDPNSPIPDGWRYGRRMDTSTFSDVGYRKKMSVKVKSDWDSSSGRKEASSKFMSNLWGDRYEEMAEKARQNGRHGLVGKKSAVALLLEYNGVEYYGWRELLEATGVTKHLYKKYYLRGIDPTSRIGKNGPQSKSNNGQCP